jgi:hypothetical protein
VLFYDVIQCLKVQDSTSSVPPSALIEVNNWIACMIYEAIEEVLHEVCMCLLMDVPDLLQHGRRSCPFPALLLDAVHIFAPRHYGFKI